MKKQYVIALAISAGAVAATAMGCELISSVDRSLIAATGSGAAGGGGGEGGAGGGVTTGGGMGGMGGGMGGMGGFPEECSNGMQDGMETGVDCGGGTCPGCANGETCMASTDCSSTFCADGVCCDTACGGVCEACALAGTEGTCTAHAAGSDPENGCATEAAATCGTTGDCNGSGACEMHPMGTACGDPASCTAGTQTNADACDGMGMCMDTGTMDCAPYMCGAMTCLTTCQNNNGCVSTHFCMGGMCMPKLANGQSCTGNGSTCMSGECVDGVCCNTACDAVCQSCAIIGAEGVCTPLPQNTVDPMCGTMTTTCDAAGVCKLALGETCSVGSDCASGNCAGNPIMICTMP